MMVTHPTILVVDDEPDVMGEGQSGTVYGLAPHPTMSRMYATACADGYVGIWDAEPRTNVKMIKVERGKVTRAPRKRGAAAATARLPSARGPFAAIHGLDVPTKCVR